MLQVATVVSGTEASYSVELSLPARPVSGAVLAVVCALLSTLVVVFV